MPEEIEIPFIHAPIGNEIGINYTLEGRIKKMREEAKRTNSPFLKAVIDLVDGGTSYGNALETVVYSVQKAHTTMAEFIERQIHEST